MIDPLYSIDPLIDPLKPIENPLKSKGVLQWTCRTCGFVVGKNGADFACVPGGYCSGADWWVEEELLEVADDYYWASKYALTINAAHKAHTRRSKRKSPRAVPMPLLVWSTAWRIYTAARIELETGGGSGVPPLGCAACGDRPRSLCGDGCHKATH